MTTTRNDNPTGAAMTTTTKTTEQRVRELFAHVTTQADKTERGHGTGTYLTGAKAGQTRWTDEWNHGYHDALADVLDTVHNLGLEALLPENTAPVMSERERNMTVTALQDAYRHSYERFMQRSSSLAAHVSTDYAQGQLDALAKLHPKAAAATAEHYGAPRTWDRKRRDLEAAATWLHTLDGAACGSGPANVGDALCSAHGRQVKVNTKAVA